MKVYVDADEVYPVYSVDTKSFGLADEIEVDSDVMARWQAAVDVYSAAQDEIATAVKQARAAKIN